MSLELTYFLKCYSFPNDDCSFDEQLNSGEIEIESLLV